MSPFANAGQFLVATAFGLAILVVLLRVWLQAAGANYYNPICQVLHRLTQPLIGPLRRVLPPLGRVETAGVVLAWLLALAKVAAMAGLAGGLPPFAALAVWALADLLSLLLWLAFWALLAGVLLSWFPVDNRNPAVPLVYQMTGPLLAPIRRLLPEMPIDLSPMIAILAVQLARILMVEPLHQLAGRMVLG
ncbi:MAG: YggT family protein [Pseudoxanthomonas sp.]|nr:YggT family protein [Pseudoxanthomonas sp.]